MRFTYLLILAGCLAVTLPLEVFARVYRQPLRLLLTLIPVVGFFTVFDEWAIWRGHWAFDSRQILGVELPFDLPVEEVLFFAVVPVCTLLTYEAVRRLTGWDRE